MKKTSLIQASEIWSQILIHSAGWRIAVVVLGIMMSPVCSATIVDASVSTERLNWFKEAKCGLFIHWGVYSVLAGSFHGARIETNGGLGEWIMFNAKIPVAEYADYAHQFNPVKFDADAWARLARDAGMKYIVITAKHHDGFAMFRSAASSFNIVDSTPFGRDPLKELAAACRKYGIRLGFYYSQAQDWHHAGGAAYGGIGDMLGGNPASGHWDRAQEGGFDQYLDSIAIPQVRELLTNYGSVSILWWDTPIGMTPERASRLAALLKLQPQMITNNRLLNFREPNVYSGDTETPEQHIPATGFKNQQFEVCMTMNETWGFKAYDQNWKSAADIIRMLIDIASKGGNFLLNVGPDANGEIPAPSVERLREFGTWLHANQESIYGTTASLFRRLPWGRSTTRGNTLYLHIFDWPVDGQLVVPGLKTPVHYVTLLGTSQSLVTRVDGTNLVVTLPEQPPDTIASVVKLEFTNSPIVEQPLPTEDPDGIIELPASLAAIINSYGANARLEGSGATLHIAGWDRPNTAVTWEYFTSLPGSFNLEVEVAVRGPVSVRITNGETNRYEKLAATGSLDTYCKVQLGIVTNARAGEQNLEITSLGKDWSEIRLRAIRLVPIR